MWRNVVVRAGCAALLLAALGACEEAEGVDVQPLPPLKRPSPEARAGLPEVAGAWRFAGWELPVRDTATKGVGMLPPGAFLVRTQRLDSVAGGYLVNGAEYPFVGEVRKDGTFTVAAFGADGAGSFAAGRVVRDTLWLELTSLSAAATWSSGTRAALVRTPPRGAPFVRYQGGFDPARQADSLRMADSLRRVDSLRALAPVVPPGGVPGAVVPGAAPVPGQPGAQAPLQPGAVPPGQVGAPPGSAPQQPATRPAPQRPRPKARPPAERPKREPPPEPVETPREEEPEPEPRPEEPPPDTQPRRPRPVIVP
ncbi:MAG TPA: hypothetical protein VF263_25220 [Longimicrobiaceae bacterium]